MGKFVDSRQAFSKSTRRLTILYIAALSSVALLAIIGQAVIQFAIEQQSGSALVINVAGRQRMLSQKISKAALVIEFSSDPVVRMRYSQELQQTRDLWQESHDGLLNGDKVLGLPGNNSDEIKHLFSVIDPNYRTMLAAIKEILVNANQHQKQSGPLSSLDPHVQVILTQELGFLTGMDQIVFQYQSESEAHISTLKMIELILFWIMLIVLVIEASFIFRPTVGKLKRTINEMARIEQSIEKQKRELERGIDLILHTHIQVANGDLSTRAPLDRDHVLWQIAYSLNNLLARVQSLSEANSELQQMRVEAGYVVGSLYSQMTHIETELQTIQEESIALLEALCEAKARSCPIRVPYSQSVLDPLCKELGGNYIISALSPGT